MILFFDDCDFEARVNLERDYGKLQYIPEATYRDPSDLSISAGLPSVVFSEELDEYVLIYNILDTADSENLDIFLCAAHSKDLIHWEPLDTTKYMDIPERKLPNQIFHLTQGESWIYEDKRADKSERYKLFYCGYGENLRMHDDLYVSPDLFHWTKIDTTWNTQGSEPGIGCAYSEKLKKYVITCRPHWADRRVCTVLTEDFRTFTPVIHSLQTDSIDEAMSEAYGMPIFEYDRFHIGLMWKYLRPNDGESVAVGNQLINNLGRMYPELAYSTNGLNYMRSLRKPFIEQNDPMLPYYGCLFTTTIIEKDDDIFIISASSQGEHGKFREKGTGSIVTFKMKKDRFICLESRSVGKLRTRNLLINGPLSINATSAEPLKARMIDSCGNTVEGFDFDDFDGFTGDSLDHKLTWQGKDTSLLKGKSVKLEMLMTVTRIYAIKGDFKVLKFNQNRLYENFGIIEEDI